MFVERPWESVTCEHGDLHAYDSVTEARPSIRQYLDWDKRAKPYSDLDQ